MMKARNKPVRRASAPRPRPASLEKWRAIQARFRHLYQVERRRMDDVERLLCEQFFISPSRLAVVLKMDLVGVEV